MTGGRGCTERSEGSHGLCLSARSKVLLPLVGPIPATLLNTECRTRNDECRSFDSEQSLSCHFSSTFEIPCSMFNILFSLVATRPAFDPLQQQRQQDQVADEAAQHGDADQNAEVDQRDEVREREHGEPHDQR